MTIYLVVAIAFLSQVGFGGSRVAVSLHALQLTANQFAIGVVIALYSLCPMLFAILIGRIADRLPARRLVIVGSVVMTLALILPFAVPGLAVLCAAAFILGLAHQVFSLPIEALVGSIDGPDKRARNYALITMAWSAANFIGPMMAGFSIDHLGQLEVYLVLAVFTFAPIVRAGGEAGPAVALRRGAQEHRSAGERARSVAHPVAAQRRSSRRASSARRRISSSSTCRSTAARSSFRLPRSARYSASRRLPRS